MECARCTSSTSIRPLPHPWRGRGSGNRPKSPSGGFAARGGRGARRVGFAPKKAGRRSGIGRVCRALAHDNLSRVKRRNKRDFGLPSLRGALEGTSATIWAILSVREPVAAGDRKGCLSNCVKREVVWSSTGILSSVWCKGSVPGIGGRADIRLRNRHVSARANGGGRPPITTTSSARAIRSISSSGAIRSFRCRFRAARRQAHDAADRGSGRPGQGRHHACARDREGICPSSCASRSSP